jgi:hypothetical protein
MARIRRTETKRGCTGVWRRLSSAVIVSVVRRCRLGVAPARAQTRRTVPKRTSRAGRPSGKFRNQSSKRECGSARCCWAVVGRQIPVQPKVRLRLVLRLVEMVERFVRLLHGAEGFDVAREPIDPMSVSPERRKRIRVSSSARPVRCAPLAVSARMTSQPATRQGLFLDSEVLSNVQTRA